jgi:hypothetical protein
MLSIEHRSASAPEPMALELANSESGPHLKLASTVWRGIPSTRSARRADPRSARPIVPAAHRRKHPIESSSSQSTSGRSATPTRRSTQNRALGSRLRPRARFCFAANPGIHFAAGRAAVKPACRFRQARGAEATIRTADPVQSCKTPPDSQSGGALSFLPPAQSV